MVGPVIGMVLWGIGMGAQESVMRAALAEMIPTERRGVAYGFQHRLWPRLVRWKFCDGHHLWFFSNAHGHSFGNAGAFGGPTHFVNRHSLEHGHEA